MVNVMASWRQEEEMKWREGSLTEHRVHGAMFLTSPLPAHSCGAVGATLWYKSEQPSAGRFILTGSVYTAPINHELPVWSGLSRTGFTLGLGLCCSWFSLLFGVGRKCVRNVFLENYRPERSAALLDESERAAQINDLNYCRLSHLWTFID